MAKMVNSFALLGDEEGDDMTVLVENFAKKVDVAPVDPAASAALVREKKQPPLNQSKGQQGNGKPAKFQPSEYGVRSEGVRGRGGRGRGGPGRGGYGRNDSENYGNDQENGYRRNYGDDSKGTGYDDSYRGRGRGRGGGRGRGRGRPFNNEPVIQDGKEGSGDNNVEDAADGWEQVPPTHSRGYGNYVNNRDEERPFRGGNRNFGGERRGYGGGNGGFRGRRDEGNYGRGEQETNEEVKVKETVNEADGNDVIVETNNASSEWDAAAAVVTEEPKAAEAEEKTQEEGVKVESPVKVDNAAKKAEEEEDENLMTLEEYEKLVAEKRKALEAQKIEERKVTADKDFEAMQLLEKKKEEILLKPEPAKLKKKDGLEKDDKPRKTLSINEFLKPADGEEFVYRRAGRGRGRGGRGGDFKTGERGGRGGDFRSGERGGRGGGERGGRGGDFRSGDFRTGERAFGNSYPRGGGRGRDAPNIPIGDQSQFPVLKAATRAVEAA